MRGNEEDKERKKNNIIHNAAYVCVLYSMCVPCMYRCKDGYGIKIMYVCVCVCSKHVPPGVCLCISVHMWTRAYLRGRMGPAFDKRGSVFPVVKYGDER